MSRTYRRKNCHIEKENLEYWKEYVKRKPKSGQYHGYTEDDEEKVEKKLKALFHNDSIHQFSGNASKKGYIKQVFRQLAKQKLLRSLKEGAEEDLVIPNYKKMISHWFYWW